jgi:hypothetical protein
VSCAIHTFSPVSVTDRIKGSSPLPNYLSRARDKLRREGYFLGDLPRTKNDSQWDRFLRDPFCLSEKERIALKNYILRPNSFDPSTADGIVEFNENFPLKELLNCLNGVPDVDIEEAVLRGRRCLSNVLMSNVRESCSNADIQAIVGEHRDSTRARLMAKGSSMPLDFALAIRLYTIKEICWPLNYLLNQKHRDVTHLANCYPYMRLLINSLRAWGREGNWITANLAYRGLKVNGTPLQARYDDYKNQFPIGGLLTLGGFTSLSLDQRVAEGDAFCDRMVYIIEEVTGVDISYLSAFDEKEILLIPPCVFKIVSVELKTDTGILYVTLKHFRQDGATYLAVDSDNDSVDDSDNDGNGNDRNHEDDAGTNGHHDADHDGLGENGQDQGRNSRDNHDPNCSMRGGEANDDIGTNSTEEVRTIFVPLLGVNIYDCFVQMDAAQSRSDIAKLLRCPEDFAGDVLQETVSTRLQASFLETLDQWAICSESGRLLLAEMTEMAADVTASNSIPAEFIRYWRVSRRLLSAYSFKETKSTRNELTDMILAMAAQCATVLYQAKELFFYAFERIDWNNEDTYFDTLLLGPLQQFSDIVGSFLPQTSIIVINGFHHLSRELCSNIISYLAEKIRLLPAWIRLVLIDESTDWRCRTVLNQIYQKSAFKQGLSHM